MDKWNTKYVYLDLITSQMCAVKLTNSTSSFFRYHFGVFVFNLNIKFGWYNHNIIRLKFGFEKKRCIWIDLTIFNIFIYHTQTFAPQTTENMDTNMARRVAKSIARARFYVWMCLTSCNKLTVKTPKILMNNYIVWSNPLSLKKIIFLSSREKMKKMKKR